MRLQKKNYEIITDELRRIIEAGIVKPGQKLDTIDALATQYRVGRSTIREAISHLKALGLVEPRQGGGTYVTSPTIKTSEIIDTLTNSRSGAELVQIMQVRQILEIGTIELAARHRTNADVEEIERIISRMKEAVGNEEISRIYDANFHIAVAKATGNPILEAMMAYISDAMHRTILASRRLWLFGEKESALQLFEEHKAMYEAIRDGDGTAAAATMARHLGKVRAALTSGHP